MEKYDNVVLNSRTKYGQFYTDPNVGRLLVSRIETAAPNSVIDLGAGLGSLSMAASKKWKSASIVSVELDSLSYFSSLKGNHFHIYADALDYDLPNKIKNEYGEFDVALCNPPYTRPLWKPEYEKILEEAGLSETRGVPKDGRAELLFLAQNLRLTKSGGELGVIVPSGIITGERSLDIRKKLLDNYCVESVVDLPRGVFSNTEAKAHILFLKKSPPYKKNIKLYEVKKKGGVSRPIFIPREAGIDRLDYGFHSQKITRVSDHCKPLSFFDVNIIRGSLSSREVREAVIPVFHTTDFPMNSGTSIVDLPIVNGGLVDRFAHAIQGDILIARVGRNLEEKVCYVREGMVPISDCIFILRIIDMELRTVVFEYLVSKEGKRWLGACSRGVGARYITRSDLLNMNVKL